MSGYVSPETIFRRVYELAAYEEMDAQDAPDGSAYFAEQDDAAEAFLRSQPPGAVVEAYVALMHDYIQLQLQLQRKTDRLEQEDGND